MSSGEGSACELDGVEELEDRRWKRSGQESVVDLDVEVTRESAGHERAEIDPVVGAAWTRVRRQRELQFAVRLGGGDVRAIALQRPERVEHVAGERIDVRRLRRRDLGLALAVGVRRVDGAALTLGVGIRAGGEDDPRAVRGVRGRRLRTGRSVRQIAQVTAVLVHDVDVGVDVTGSPKHDVVAAWRPIGQGIRLGRRVRAGDRLDLTRVQIQDREPLAKGRAVLRERDLRS